MSYSSVKTVRDCDHCVREQVTVRPTLWRQLQKPCCCLLEPSKIKAHFSR